MTTIEEYKEGVIDRVSLSYIRLDDLKKELIKHVALIGDEPLEKLDAVRQTLESCLCFSRQRGVVGCSQPSSGTTGT